MLGSQTTARERRPRQPGAGGSVDGRCAHCRRHTISAVRTSTDIARLAPPPCQRLVNNGGSGEGGLNSGTRTGWAAAGRGPNTLRAETAALRAGGYTTTSFLSPPHPTPHPPPQQPTKNLTTLAASAATKVNNTKLLAAAAVPKTNWTAKASAWNATLASKAAYINRTLAAKAAAVPTVNKTALLPTSSFASKNWTQAIATINSTKASLAAAAAASAPKPKNLTAILAPYAAAWNASKPAKKNVTLTYVDPSPAFTAAWNKSVAKLNLTATQAATYKAVLNATLARKAGVVNATLANKATKLNATLAAVPAVNKTALIASLPTMTAKLNKTTWG